ncbi:MAG: hypothetical protein U0235_17560 [Polyangiaceae bacterium]
MSLRRSASFIALSFGVALSACQALVGLATREEAPAPDGSTPPPPPDVDAGADVTSAPRPECAQDLPPPSVVPSVNDIPPFAMALATGGYTSPDAGVLCPVPGFDFDGKRTCLDDGGRSSHNLAVCDGGADASCQSSCENRRALDTETASTLCDLANGVDNAFQGITIALRSSISKVQVDRIVDLTALFQSGAATLVFNVSGYSGEPDDDHVAVSVFNGTGLAGGATSWDGQSQITWDVTSYGLRVDGYVRNGVLVLPQIRRLYLPVFAAAGVRVPLVPMTDVRIQGRLVRSGSAYAIASGVFGGRIASRDLLRTAANLPAKVFDPDGGDAPSCIAVPESLVEMRDLVCQYADLRGATSTCDALSAGFVFSATSITIGAVDTNPAPPVDDCRDAGSYDPDANCEP